MKAIILVVLGLAISVQSSEIEQKGYDIQWKNEMRLYGTHPDTIQMFLEAPLTVPLDTIPEFEGSFVPKTIFKRISDDGQVGWLFECISRKKIAENGSTYWEYVIKEHKVFDTRGRAKK